MMAATTAATFPQLWQSVETWLCGNVVWAGWEPPHAFPSSSSGQGLLFLLSEAPYDFPRWPLAVARTSGSLGLECGMESGFFKLDGMSSAVVAVDDGSRWNGFGCPLFTKEQTLHFIQEWDKIRTPGEDPHVFWHETEQAFFIHYGDAGHHPMSGETVVVADIEGIPHYRVGNGWAWHVVKYEPSVQPERVVKPDWVHTMPVISTAHLRMETAQLDWAEVWPMLVSAVPSDDSGIMVKLRDTPKGELPEELEAVFQWAKQLGYTWVRFDSDGDVIEGLPVFDW